MILKYPQFAVSDLRHCSVCPRIRLDEELRKVDIRMTVYSTQV